MQENKEGAMVGLSRQLKRRILRRLSENVVRRIAVMSRSQRRLTAKVYANATYREIYATGPYGGYGTQKAHPSIVKWIAEEWRKLGEKIAKTQASEAEVGEGTHLGMDAHDGEGQDSTASDGNDREMSKVSGEVEEAGQATVDGVQTVRQTVD